MTTAMTKSRKQRGPGRDGTARGRAEADGQRRIRALEPGAASNQAMQRAPRGGPVAAATSGPASVQRQASVGGGPELAPPIVHEVLNSPGQPLDAQTRAFFEPRFGQDFTRVRVHTDAKAAESARAVAANAYAVGGHIAFEEGQFQPRTARGCELMAHELAHVVQQQGKGSSQVNMECEESPLERDASSIASHMARTNSQCDVATTTAPYPTSSAFPCPRHKSGAPRPILRPSAAVVLARNASGRSTLPTEGIETAILVAWEGEDKTRENVVKKLTEVLGVRDPRVVETLVEQRSNLGDVIYEMRLFQPMPIGEVWDLRVQYVPPSLGGSVSTQSPIPMRESRRAFLTFDFSQRSSERLRELASTAEVAQPHPEASLDVSSGRPGVELSERLRHARAAERVLQPVEEIANISEAVLQLINFGFEYASARKIVEELAKFPAGADLLRRLLVLPRGRLVAWMRAASNVGDVLTLLRGFAEYARRLMEGDEVGATGALVEPGVEVVAGRLNPMMAAIELASDVLIAIGAPEEIAVFTPSRIARRIWEFARRSVFGELADLQGEDYVELQAESAFLLSIPQLGNISRGVLWMAEAMGWLQQRAQVAPAQAQSGLMRLRDAISQLSESISALSRAPVQVRSDYLAYVEEQAPSQLRFETMDALDAAITRILALSSVGLALPTLSGDEILPGQLENYSSNLREVYCDSVPEFFDLFGVDRRKIQEVVNQYKRRPVYY